MDNMQEIMKTGIRQYFMMVNNFQYFESYMEMAPHSKYVTNINDFVLILLFLRKL